MIGCLDDMDQLSRRRFLQISAATFGAAAATIPLRSSWAAAEALAAKSGELRIVPTTCDMCFWKCGALAYVRDGKLWKVEGNPLDPLSRGRLCTRGTGGIGACEDPDRLRTPLLRVGERGREEWKSVTWGEALDFTAKRLKEIAAAHGPESIAMFKHGIGAYFVEHALKAFGTPNIAAPSFAQCRGPRDVGYTLTVGLTPGSPETLDIAHTRCLVLLGSHIGENMHNTQVQEFADAIRSGATVIVADPRFSTAASKAKYWLPLRAGTDLALLLAWMNVIVSEGLYDKKFVAEHGEGFDAFAKALAPSTPQWAAKETGLDAKLIVATAREMAKHRPATLIHPGRRSAWYGDDTQRSRANALLNALMGNFGHKGGFYVPSYTELPEYPGVPKYPKSARGKADNPGKRWPFADQTVTTGLREATVTGKPYPIKGWVVDGTNLLQAMPDRKRTLAAIAALDLLVVVDTVPSEMAGYADVVLPEAMYLERYDTLNEDCLRVPFIALRQPVVEPPHEQKPGWWIGRELGIRLGLESYFPWKDAEQCLRTRLEKGGFDWAELKAKGVIVAEKKPLFIEDGAEIAFETPSGKVEFWSKQLADKGFDAVPKYTRPDPGPKGSYRLITGRAPMHTFSRTIGNPRLAELMPENEVWMNAAQAKKLGLKNGVRVRLKNQDGVQSEPVKLLATERIHPECVYLVHGFGSESKAWKGAWHKGAATAQLTTDVRIDPLMGGTSIHTNFVSVEKVA
jgi:thiosulfate reductase/polysulfide reductase chain A